MINNPMCYGWWAECPRNCTQFEVENNYIVCKSWNICFENWKRNGGKLGLFDIVNKK